VYTLLLVLYLFGMRCTYTTDFFIFLKLNGCVADVPEGCVILREHVPISNLFTCLWFNEVDRFTSRDQLSFSTVRDKILSRVDFHFNMFLDCERRNFVVQVNCFILPVYLTIINFW
jgi:hypothetical protein